MSVRVASAILVAASLACALARAEAPEGGTDALRRAALEAEDARFHRTVELADLRSREGKLDEAKTLYDEALALRFDDAEVMKALLGVLRRRGDWAAQRPLYERLAARAPGDSALAFDAAECLWRLGRADEAKRAWTELLLRVPTERAVFDRLIEFYVAERLASDARAVLEDRRARFGDDPELRIVEARLALVEKKPDAAIAALLSALDDDLDPSDREQASEMLLAIAAETGRAGDVARTLADSLARADARLAERLLELARRSADADDIPAAISLAERAVPLLRETEARMKTVLQIGVWKTAK